MLHILLGLMATAGAASKFETVFVGEDSRSGACELRVIKTYHKGNTGKWEDFRAEVSTGYSHGSDVPGDVIVETDAKDLKLMSGKNSSDSEIRVTFDKEQTFDTARAYSLKWKHHDHFHTFVCKKLKAKTTP